MTSSHCGVRPKSPSPTVATWSALAPRRLIKGRPALSRIYTGPAAIIWQTDGGNSYTDQGRRREKPHAKAGERQYSAEERVKFQTAGMCQLRSLRGVERRHDHTAQGRRIVPRRGPYSLYLGQEVPGWDCYPLEPEGAAGSASGPGSGSDSGSTCGRSGKRFSLISEAPTKSRYDADSCSL